MSAISLTSIVGIVGGGTMGQGIAQVAAAAGHQVVICDARPGGAEQARSRIEQDLQRLVAKGKITQAAAQAQIARLGISDTIDGLASVTLVIEAIYEDLAAKRSLFSELERVVSEHAILATNTSSISVTAIAAGLQHPGRLAGMHFFNPAPLMKLVEIVAGVASSEQTLQTLAATAEAWGKAAVRTKSTPGFIVNRVARSFYGEPLRLLDEQVADHATIDVLITGSGGFRMGPFALMDLIGNDVNYAVTTLIFNAFYGDPRFRPSLTQLEFVNAGWLGRKSGRGFYNYGAGAAQQRPTFSQAEAVAHPLQLDDLFQTSAVEREGIMFARTDGRTARECAESFGQPVLLYDLVKDAESANVIGFACSPDVPCGIIDRFVAFLNAAGKSAIVLPDWPGLVVMRTVAMIVNEAYETILEGVCEKDVMDTAIRHGLNYPLGPIEWAERIGLDTVLGVIDAIHTATRDPRYRASYGLRNAVSTRTNPRPVQP